MAQRLLRKRQASQLTPSRPGGPQEDTRPAPSSDAPLVAEVPLWMLMFVLVEVVVEAAAVVLIAVVVFGVATDENEAEEAEGELVREVTGEVVELIRGCW